jgi:hypothetical protein
VAACLLLGLGAIALYAPALTCGFVNYDDQLYVTGNPHVNHGLTLEGLRWAFQAGYAANWHPLTWLSHMADVQFFGLRAGGHHVTSVLLHALNSVLLFLVLRQMTGAFWRSAAVAALFVCHPLHVESVAWIAERKDVLSTFFWMLALWAWLGYAKNGRAGISILCYAAALLAFACGLMSKPMVVTLPCVLLLLDWWPLRRLQLDRSPLAPQIIGLVAEKLPFFLLTIASGVITVVAQRREGAVAIVNNLPIKIRLATALYSCFRYLAKTLWPSDLGAMYPFVLKPAAAQLAAVSLALIMVTVLGVREWKMRPYWLFGWLWFLGTLFPTLNLLTGGGQPMADRYVYIPSVGLFVMLCWGAYDWAAERRWPQTIQAGVFGVTLAAYCLAASLQIRHWKNEEGLLSHIAMADSNFVAHANYAAFLMRHKRLAEAEAECNKAIRILPTDSALYVLQADIFLDEGRPDDAIEKLNFALAMDPGLVGARLPLGQAFLAKKMPDEAAEQFRAVLQADPGNADATAGLARAEAAEAAPGSHSKLE